ncbi:hypothetical protein Tco_1131453 [Tanacetum coccineum]
MVNTRSRDTGLLTNPEPLETRVNNLATERNNGGQIGNNGGNNGGAYGRLTKIEFHKFEGDDVLSWLYRVNKFFEMDHIDDDAQKIRLFSMHMFGKVYQESFEDLLNKVALSDEYDISFFIGGLKEDIAYVVRMFKPNTLSDVFRLGRGNVTRNVTTMHVQNNTPMPNRRFKKLTQQELEDKRAKHLCFYCGQKYTPGHKCSGQLYSLEVIREGLDDEEDGDMQLTEEGVMSTYTTSLIDEPPLISLNALTDENRPPIRYRTMSVKALMWRKDMWFIIG